MNVPLSVTPTVKYRKEKLIIWQNGEEKEIDAPIKPYFYTYKKLEIDAEESNVEGIALSSYQTRKFLKYEFKLRDDLVKCRDSIEDAQGKGIIFEGHITFVIRNRIDIPDLYTKFPHTKPFTFLFFDIEQFMKPGKMFPDYSDRITSIAYCTNDRIVNGIRIKKESLTDEPLLKKFLEEYKRINPDVLIVYNKSYDIPTLFNRCVRNRIDVSAFTKNGTKPQFGANIDIPGTVVYDILPSAQADQSLTGNVQNKGLKEVSDYFGFKSPYKVLTPKEMIEFIGTDTLTNYNKDDVRRMLLLFDIYWPNIEFNANDLNIPLNMAVELDTTKLALIVIGDEFRKRNIISDGDNYSRYPEIFQRKKKPEEPNYQGALIGITKSGLSKPVYKADYGSMYPAIMASFNLSPDTTTLIMLTTYDGKFKIKDEGDWFIYEIPDDVLKKNMVIQVLKKDGFMSALVFRYLKERAEYKRLWKETDDKKYRSMSDNRKVKANGTYGITGTPKHPYGFVPIAIATTGIGRECAQLLIDVLNQLYPNSVIEYDTDGVYFTTNNFNKDEVLALFNQRLKEKFQKDLKLSIDFDSYDAGYFYLAKNYVLLKGEKIIMHGVALKASSKDLLSKSLIKEMAYAKLHEKPTDDIIRKYMKLDFPLEYFAMNTKLGMRPNEYKNKNTLVLRLAMDAKERFGIPITVGQQYYYIKTPSDYMLYDLAKLSDIDKQYYLDEVNDIVDMFQEKHIATSVDKWLK